MTGDNGVTASQHGCSLAPTARREEKIKCPECDGAGGGMSWGDGWEEWDECPLCNPDGKDGSGMTTAERVSEYRATLDALDARIEAEMNEPCRKCSVARWACECGEEWGVEPDPLRSEAAAEEPISSDGASTSSLAKRGTT